MSFPSILHRVSPILALVVFCAVEAVGQTPEPPRPKAPFVKTAPLGSRWFVVIDHSKANGGAAKQPSGKAVVVQPVKLEKSIGLNGAQRGVITYANNVAADYYVAGEYVFETEKGKVIATSFEELARRAGQDPLVSKTFPCISWISGNNYTATEKIGLANCYKYSADVHDGDSSAEHREAWIDATTLYPVKLIVGNVIYTFSPIAVMNENISLPPEAQAKSAKLTAQQQAIQRLLDARR